MPTGHRLSRTLALYGLLGLAAASAAAQPAPDGPDATGPASTHQAMPAAAPAVAAGSSLARQVSDAASELVAFAVDFLGVPYRRGGVSPEQGFDCSGFTQHVFDRSLGLLLPRRSDQQARDAGLLSVDRHELRPGDLVFFDTMRRAFSHVGIYLGEGKFVHAPRSGAQVRIDDMRGAYWARRFNGARRAADVGSGSTPAMQHNPARP